MNRQSHDLTKLGLKFQSCVATRDGRRTKKNPAGAGWPRRLVLVRVTPHAEVEVVSAQLCSRLEQYFRVWHFFDQLAPS